MIYPGRRRPRGGWRDGQARAEMSATKVVGFRMRTVDRGRIDGPLKCRSKYQRASHPSQSGAHKNAQVVVAAAAAASSK